MVGTRGELYLVPEAFPPPQMGAQAVGFIAFVKILVSQFMVRDFIAEDEGGRFEQAMGDPLPPPVSCLCDWRSAETSRPDTVQPRVVTIPPVDRIAKEQPLSQAA